MLQSHSYSHFFTRFTHVSLFLRYYTHTLSNGKCQPWYCSIFPLFPATKPQHLCVHPFVSARSLSLVCHRVIVYMGHTTCGVDVALIYRYTLFFRGKNPRQEVMNSSSRICVTCVRVSRRGTRECSVSWLYAVRRPPCTCLSVRRYARVVTHKKRKSRACTHL